MAKFFWNYLNIKPHWHPGRLVPLKEALEWQERFLLLKTKGHPETNKITDYNFFVFTEPEPVYSYPPKLEGQLNDNEVCKKYLKVGLQELPAPLVKLPRDHGGSITYHGPGQLVCYLILDLEDIGFWKPPEAGFGMLKTNRAIDAALSEVIRKLGVTGYSLSELIRNSDEEIREQLLKQNVLQIDKDGNPYGVSSAQGIWVVENGEAKKIASRALGYVKYVYGKNREYADYFTTYGFALNVSPDLSHFEFINPCGLPIQMTSLEQITGVKHNLPKIAKMLAQTLVEKIKEFSGDDSHELL